MKNTNVCPKCESAEIIRVPVRFAEGPFGNRIMIGAFSSIEVTRFVCRRCGFSEEWIEDNASLKKLKKRYGIRRSTERRALPDCPDWPEESSG